MIKKIVYIFVGICVAIFILIQFVPYGHNHTNPPVTKTIKWNSPQTAQLVHVCYQCHSNETEWPWYTNIAPGSWLIQHDVDEARLFMNFSENDVTSFMAQDMASQVKASRMPPIQYKIVHWDAFLTDTQKQELIDGIQKTFANLQQ